MWQELKQLLPWLMVFPAIAFSVLICAGVFAMVIKAITG